MSGILWELLAFIYVKAYSFITQEIVPSCFACLGKRILVPDDILD
jgi:hypothetical protein